MNAISLAHTRLKPKRATLCPLDRSGFNLGPMNAFIIKKRIIFVKEYDWPWREPQLEAEIEALFFQRSIMIRKIWAVIHHEPNNDGHLKMGPEGLSTIVGSWIDDSYFPDRFPFFFNKNSICGLDYHQCCPQNIEFFIKEKESKIHFLLEKLFDRTVAKKSS
jgi:hypothetical protein